MTMLAARPAPAKQTAKAATASVVEPDAVVVEVTPVEGQSDVIADPAASAPPAPTPEEEVAAAEAQQPHAAGTAAAAYAAMANLERAEGVTAETPVVAPPTSAQPNVVVVLSPQASAAPISATAAPTPLVAVPSSDAKRDIKSGAGPAGAAVKTASAISVIQNTTAKHEPTIEEILKALKVAVDKYEKYKQSLGENKRPYMQTLKDIADFFLVNLSNRFIFDNAYLFVHSMVLIDAHNGCGNTTFYNDYLLPQLKQINIVLQEQGSLATKAVALVRRNTNKFYLYLNNKGYTPKVIESFEDVAKKIIEDHYCPEWPSSLRFMKYLLSLFWAAFQKETASSTLEELLRAVDIYYGACKQAVDKATQPYQLQLVLSAGDMFNVNQLLAQGLPMGALLGIITDKTYAKNFYSNDKDFFRHCTEYEKLLSVLRQCNFLHVICEFIKKCYIARASKNGNTTNDLQADAKSASAAAEFSPPQPHAPSAAASAAAGANKQTSAAVLVAVAGSSSSPIYSGSAAAVQPDSKNAKVTLQQDARELDLLLSSSEGSQFSELNLVAIKKLLAKMSARVESMEPSSAAPGPTPSAPPAPGGPG